ncbi:MAG TPA: hypothetical protein VJS64_13965, partial [Pyrinomonadaceae bacterium]|nr:hypothetical protein [Pyrinomonadaceae bacterium]
MNNRLTLILSAVVLIGIALLIDTYRTNAQLKQSDSVSDKRGRVMEDQSHSDTPVKIVEVRNGKHIVRLRQSFNEGDDWLKGLSIIVENRSQVPVSHVGIDLLIERPQEQLGELPAFWKIVLGANPFWLKPEERASQVKVRTIQPGEKATVSLSDDSYKEMRAFLKKAGYLSSGEKVRVAISTIGFTDGSAWRGQLYYPDPAAPDGWRTEEKPSGSANGRTAFFVPFSKTERELFHKVNWGN